MKTTIYILTILTLIGCSENKQKSETQNNSVEVVKELENEQQKNESLKTNNIKAINCNQFSKAMTELKKLLEQDNYRVEIKEQQNDLLFAVSNFPSISNKDQIKFSFPKSEYLSFYVERKNKLEGTKDNWYPSFSVTEICFQDESTAVENHGKISKIISGNDTFNDKNYDYLLQNGNRLIYVSCRARVFLEYAFSYKDKIKGIIKKNKS
tara:strand:+ start:254 stop:880 length:627 start_codon:yes stop_codon:yes gene_type:complete